MPEADGRADLVVRWLAKADGDLAMARLAMEHGGIEPWIIGFHAQRSAEKRLKAVIAATGSEPPYTHNLVMLLGLLPADLAPSVTPEQLGLLTTYAAATRYVMADVPEEDDPSAEDAREAMGWADNVARDTDGWLRGHGFVTRNPESTETPAGPVR